MSGKAISIGMGMQPFVGAYKGEIRSGLIRTEGKITARSHGSAPDVYCGRASGRCGPVLYPHCGL